MILRAGSTRMHCGIATAVFVVLVSRTRCVADKLHGSPACSTVWALKEDKQPRKQSATLDNVDQRDANQHWVCVYCMRCACVQDYLCRRADKHMIPKVDNTNVDRSVATIHATVLACLRHTAQISALNRFQPACSGSHFQPVCLPSSINWLA